MKMDCGDETMTCMIGELLYGISLRDDVCTRSPDSKTTMAFDGEAHVFDCYINDTETFTEMMNGMTHLMGLTRDESFVECLGVLPELSLLNRYLKAYQLDVEVRPLFLQRNQWEIASLSVQRQYMARSWRKGDLFSRRIKVTVNDAPGVVVSKIVWLLVIGFTITMLL